MARPKKATNDLKFKELDLQEAQRVFSRRRGRASKYDQILDAAEKLNAGKALVVEQMSYSEVTGIRKKIKEYLGEGWMVEATKGDREKNLFDVLVYREK
jgi:hypothetical protein